MPMDLVYFMKGFRRKHFTLKGNVVLVEARVTGMAASNALGEKLHMFVIGKYANPRCFKNVTNKPCRYKSQAKTWMIFED